MLQGVDYFYQTRLPLIAIGLLFASIIWGFRRYPPPGAYIAFAAVGGIVVTIRPPASPWSRAEWLGLFIFLGLFEIFNLYRDRREHSALEAASRKEDRDAFKGIADGITTAIETAQRGFAGTVKHLENLASLSAENINTVTGGDSFCYLQFLGNTVNSGTGTPMLLHEGKYPLYGVMVRITDLAKFKIGALSDTIIGPRDMTSGLALIEKQCPVPFSDPSEQNFNIFFTAKNGFWSQILRMRMVNGNWLSALRVTKGGAMVKEEIHPDFPIHALENDHDWTVSKPAGATSAEITTEAVQSP